MPGLGDIKKIMQQAQKFQEQMAQKQSLLASREVSATSGGGMVTVVASGDQKIKSIKIEKEAIDPSDPQMLEDLVLAAVNEALKKSREMAEQEMQELTSGLKLNIPGLG